VGFENWCRHFNGIHNGVCKVGIRYKDVRDDSSPARFPCFKSDACIERCASVSFLSEEEIAAEEQRSSEVLAAYLGDLASNTCPFCKKPIERKQQIGRCVYALPCYHRLYQGVVPKSERTPADQKQIDEASLWEEMEE